jgi:hypothetical protein
MYKGEASDNVNAEATWNVLKAALTEWQSILDDIFPSLLEWAGPHQPDWLRRLAFGVVGSVVRDAPLSLDTRAMGAFDRYSFPLLPLLNASLSEAVDEAEGSDSSSEEPRLDELHTRKDQATMREARRGMLQNAAYCVGALASQGEKGVALEALKLHPMLLELVRPDRHIDAVVYDNAVC